MFTSLDIAQAGYRRFPLSTNSKMPLAGSNGLHDASSDLAIAAAQTSFSNQGIATGHGDLVVLDIDADKSGQTAIAHSQVWKAICAVLGSQLMAQAMQVGTPSGGVHIYVRCPVPIRMGTNVLPTNDGVKLDVRAVGAYVVAPGSVIDGKQYAASGDNLVPLDSLPIVDFSTLQMLGCAAKQNASSSSVPKSVTPASNNLNANPLTAWKHVATQAVQSGNLDLNTNDGFETLAKALAYAVREEGHPVETVWQLLDELCEQYDGYDQAQNRLRFDSFVASQPDNPVTFATLRFLAKAPSKLGTQQPGVLDLAEAKKRFLFVRNFMGGPVYIDQKNAAHPMSVKAFEDGYDQRVADPETGKPIRLGLAFKKYPHLREAVDRITFDPDSPHGIVDCPEGLRVWNSYRAPDFPLGPSQLSLGDRCIKIRNFIFSVICGGDDERWTYLFLWLAWNVQNPGSKPEVAIALNGPKGCGKSTMLRIFVRLMAPHALVCSKTRQVFGDFNDHLREVLALGLEEVFWAGDPNAQDQVKALITESELVYERKNKTPESARSYPRLMIASNHAHAIPATLDERRYMMLSVEGGYYQESDWDQLNASIDGEGLAAFYQLLLEHQLGSWHPRDNVPKTQALANQKLHGLGVTYEGFLLHLLENEALPGGLQSPSTSDVDWKGGPLVLSSAGKDVLLKFAEEWRKGQAKGRYEKPFAKGPLMKALKRYFGAKETRGSGTRDWDVPDHATCKRNFALAIGVDEAAIDEI